MPPASVWWGQLTTSAAAEPSKLVRERAMPHHRELAVRACQRCVQLRRPPEVLGEGSRLYYHDRVELKSTCLLRVIEANLKSILGPDDRFSSRLPPAKFAEFLHDGTWIHRDDGGRPLAVLGGESSGQFDGLRQELSCCVHRRSSDRQPAGLNRSAATLAGRQ